MYLAVHRVSYCGQDGDFLCLTAGAIQADASYLKDPGIRQTHALSSEEFTNLLNQIPACKQLLILDVCAAERIALAARDLSASQRRALDKLYSWTGFYMLAGSAADAVSYESNVYDQGLLTYSLLQRIRGGALLREGQEYYVDVDNLLNHVVETVSGLANQVRGI